MSFLALLALSLLLSYAAYLLAPKAESTDTDASDLTAPTVSAGRPVPVVFGTLELHSPNVLGYWDKRVKQYKVDA